MALLNGLIGNGLKQRRRHFKLYDKYEECKDARIQEGLDHVEGVLKLTDKIKKLGLQYSKLITNINKLLDQQVVHVCPENYHKKLNEDEEGGEYLRKKQLIISDLKNIHVAQGYVIRNLKKGRNEVKG